MATPQSAAGNSQGSNVTGTNTYSQVVRRYRDRLLAAHAASCGL